MAEKPPVAEYRVLARKYRPVNFAGLVGQEALVRTLTNAIRSGRLAHAFMLTGVRGVGKTTTARIIARALNCTGHEEKGPTAEPCGACDSCISIGQDRHVDVIEMDAASNTGVDNIREIIEGVRYAPVSARYKVYIIDEVHMLSKSAFNALLKTLEEPPPHVKFVFATTEIRKVPVTVLSRCQRFDLRRVEGDVLAGHFTRVSEKEGVTVEPDALAMIVRAADGSVRDGLSLLDQAIALSGGTVTAAQVSDMLGLADRAVVMDLFEACVSGKAGEALGILSDMHRRGADPVMILQDLLETVHNLTRLLLVPDLATDLSIPEIERVRGAKLAASLSIPLLTRAWQILLKGLGEVQQAPDPLRAAEMILVRLVFTANLPTPGDLVRQLRDNPAAGAEKPAPVSDNGGGPPPAKSLYVAARGSGGAVALAVATPVPAEAVATDPDPESFVALVRMFSEKREGALYGFLYSAVHLVKFETGRLEIRLGAGTPGNLPARVAECLKTWTGRRWMVSISRGEGELTLSQQEVLAERAALDQAADHPLVRQILEAFPGAAIAQVRTRVPETPVSDSPASDLIDNPAGFSETFHPDIDETERDLLS
ncbi:MAG: DNA polymerase III subunit gamma/tau [Pseudomonadota bacterium]|nr:DNA polymerase III subunit gamma/tau [Pseudomonadota bacterium]